MMTKKAAASIVVGCLFAWGLGLAAIGFVPWEALPVVFGVTVVCVGLVALMNWGVNGKLALVALVLLPAAARAQSTTDYGKVDAVLSNPLSLLTAFYEACKHGQGYLAGALLLFITVGALRVYGKKAHDKIPDDTQHPVLKPLEKVLGFFFDTKKGGWALNFLTAFAAALGVPYLAGMTIDASSWRLAFEVSAGGVMASTFINDVAEAREKVPDPHATAPGGGVS